MPRPPPRTRPPASEHHLHRAPIGAPPGTLEVDPELPQPALYAFGFDDDAFVEQALAGPDDIAPLRARCRSVWLNVDGLGNEAVIRRIGEIFGLHPLALEDIVHLHQRAKTESYPTFSFFVARMLSDGDDEQISLVLGADFVISFQERPGSDVFDAVRLRLRAGRNRIRHVDYLFYALLDAVIDAWFPVLERAGDRLEELEDRILEDPSNENVQALHGLKRELLTYRRAIWPLREAINGLMRTEQNTLVSDETRLFLRDCYDHSVQLIDLVENYREIAAGLMDLYLSSVSNKLNEVMKVLTIIATFFLPLGFIAGVYGMNFEYAAGPLNMPELHQPWGYPFALALMSGTAFGMFVYFRRRGWL